MCSYTIPIVTFTSRATITTRAEMIKPWIIGLIPDFFMLANDVLRAIAAGADTIRNLLIFLVAATSAVGIENIKALKSLTFYINVL